MTVAIRACRLRRTDWRAASIGNLLDNAVRRRGSFDVVNRPEGGCELTLTPPDDVT